MADENTERRTTLILRKIVRQWKTFTHAQYITIMYALDSTRQKFDDWIGVAFLSDNATRPVERAAEMR